MDKIKVQGKNNRHKVLLYAISTCPWCKKEKQLLKDNNIEFEYIDVDLCNDEDYEEIRKDILNRGGRFSFPVIIIDDKTLINGFKENEIMEALEN
ncbi:MAG: glutaredoxin family protein [Candidatus Bathyarchaeota archaeon]|jgi:glutaredoxin-like protein NrdH